jgi:hypothetical protein
MKLKGEAVRSGTIENRKIVDWRNCMDSPAAMSSLT